ncbi:pimeloyl-ACP methyl ester carboxylesterase [Actinocorallia herbida]|uniref:Pimeloyl-ACP methyl ester carboxylesterase n=1 Tax=Actinocorallia herbida TaxID=58109 RepID=A0A3N1CZK6_9ACTN|nr:alpha/beta hydrolase [Actinocorallia herbida]ROO86218.1 pimeloyl-ACP methyl ester carboxylesterase [Actinocorallia herbida]
MPAVLVHGVPETAELWGPLRARLRRDDVVALRLPGFGRPLPPGFQATKEGYAAWLTEAVAELGGQGPVDLVGHDWGGGLVVRLVSLRPDLVRSWATDAAALADPAYEWHEHARLFQTPGVGEDLLSAMTTLSADDYLAGLRDLGLPLDATDGLTGLDEMMARCILTLYRSAVHVGAEWAPAFVDVGAPGLVIAPAKDAFLPEANTRAAAARAGAHVTELPGAGHWWMLEDPARAAAVLQEFWDGLPA